MRPARPKKRSRPTQKLPSLKRRRLGNVTQKTEKTDATKPKKGHCVDTQEFYQSLKASFDYPMCEQPPKLSVQLFHYQRRAVYWMTQREKEGHLDGCTGGILADEMGLGKTISALSNILVNTRTSAYNIQRYGPWSSDEPFAQDSLTQPKEESSTMSPSIPPSPRMSTRQQAKKNNENSNPSVPAVQETPTKQEALPTSNQNLTPMRPVTAQILPPMGYQMATPAFLYPGVPSFGMGPPPPYHLPHGIPTGGYLGFPPGFSPQPAPFPFYHRAYQLNGYQHPRPTPLTTNDQSLMLHFKLNQPLHEIISGSPLKTDSSNPTPEPQQTPQAFTGPQQNPQDSLTSTPEPQRQTPQASIAPEPQQTSSIQTPQISTGVKSNHTQPLFDSKTTLIIAPLILIKQWNSEIEKHTKGLRVTIYKGFKHLSKKELKKSERKNIFRKYDIVLTDYQVLRTELHFSKKSDQQLRTQNKKFYSPLIGINWWRICIDEAQEVKTSSTQVSQMASTIPARNRWAITGTPIKTSFDDLLGTLIFLHCPSKWKLTTEELLAFFKRIAWRYEKKDVEDEITIPKPKEVETIVQLTRLDLICESKLTSKLPQGDAMNAAARHILSKFKSAPFLVVLNDVLQKKTSPKIADRLSVINALITETTNELFQTQKDTTSAISCYTQSLDLGCYRVGTPTYEKFCRFDDEHVLSPPVTAGFSSVTYHACINLGLLLKEIKDPSADIWLSESEIVKRNALNSAHQMMSKALSKWDDVSAEATLMAKNRLRSGYDPWWVRALTFISSFCRDQFIQQLRRGVKQGYSTKFHEMTEHTLRMPDLNSIEDLKVQLAKDIDLIYRARAKCTRLLKKPLATDRGELQNSTAFVQEMEAAMVHYEQSLAQKQIVKRGNVDQEVKMLALSERALLFLERVVIDQYNLLLERSKTMPPALNAKERAEQELLNTLSLISLEGEAYFRELEVMKIEVAIGGKYIDECHKYIKTWKELEDKLTVVTHSQPQNSDIRPIGSAKPTKVKRGSAKIRKSISDLKSEESQEEALLSIEALEAKLTTLQNQCISTKSLLSELYSISHRTPPAVAHFGPKLEAVTKEILAALAVDPNTKILVFSAWPEALEQLGVLLSVHTVKFSGGMAGITSGGSSISGRIDNFRLDPTLNVLLLNAVKQSTGLTLTMANQIFLLDPLDQANEVQAIGRAYRIGQQKQTIIRRFLFATENTQEPMEIIPDAN